MSSPETIFPKLSSKIQQEDDSFEENENLEE